MTATLGQLLTQWRSQRKMTLREVGRQAGIAHSTLGRWEKGAFLPRLPELEAVLKVLGATEAQRRQALTLLDTPRTVAYKKQETTQADPDFVKAAGGIPGEGEILRAMRLRAGKTLEDVARSIGVAGRTLSRWERSEMRPDAFSLHALCYALGAGEEEIAALTCSEGMSLCLPNTNSPAEIATQALALRLGVWKPSAGLMELICLHLEMQTWKLIPYHPEAKQVLFALIYWRMKTLYDTGNYEKASVYGQRVVGLAEMMPPTFSVPLLTSKTLPEQRVQTHETDCRARLYQTVCAAQRKPKAGQKLARGLAQEWKGAYDVYFRAWMMSEAATMLVQTGNSEMALNLGQRACEEADTGDVEHWTEPLFRRRDYATLLCQMGRDEDALTALDASTELNHRYPDCRARYYLLRTEAFLNLSRIGQAHEELSQACTVINNFQLEFMMPRVETLESRF